MFRQNTNEDLAPQTRESSGDRTSASASSNPRAVEGLTSDSTLLEVDPARSGSRVSHYPGDGAFSSLSALAALSPDNVVEVMKSRRKSACTDPSRPGDWSRSAFQPASSSTGHNSAPREDGVPHKGLSPSSAFSICYDKLNGESRFFYGGLRLIISEENPTGSDDSTQLSEFLACSDEIKSLDVDALRGLLKDLNWVDFHPDFPHDISDQAWTGELGRYLVEEKEYVSQDNIDLVVKTAYWDAVTALSEREGTSDV